MTTVSTLVQSIGAMVLRSAREQAPQGWDYAGYVFATPDGITVQTAAFLFRKGVLQEFSLRHLRKELRAAHLELREAMRLQGDAPWVTSNAVVQHENLAIKQIYEFDKTQRWLGGPMDPSQKFALLVKEVFPDALGP